MAASQIKYGPGRPDLARRWGREVGARLALDRADSGTPHRSDARTRGRLAPSRTPCSCRSQLHPRAVRARLRTRRCCWRGGRANKPALRVALAHCEDAVTAQQGSHGDCIARGKRGGAFAPHRARASCPTAAVRGTREWWSTDVLTSGATAGRCARVCGGRSRARRRHGPGPRCAPRPARAQRRFGASVAAVEKARTRWRAGPEHERVTRTPVSARLRPRCARSNEPFSGMAGECSWQLRISAIRASRSTTWRDAERSSRREPTRSQSVWTPEPPGQHCSRAHVRVERARTRRLGGITSRARVRLAREASRGPGDGRFSGRIAVAEDACTVRSEEITSTRWEPSTRSRRVRRSAWLASLGARACVQLARP